MTKGEHRDKVIVLAQQYAPLLKIPAQIIDQFVEYAVRYVWRTLLLSNEALQRKTVVVNHGDPLPADWVAFGNRAYYTLSASVIPIRWIPLGLVPTRKTAQYNRALPTQPDFYTVNQQTMFLPDTTMTDPTTGNPYIANLGTVTLHYYPRPTKLFGDTIPDLTDDGLPAFSAPYVHRAAFKRILEFMVTGPKRKQLLDQARKESIESIGQLFQQLQGIQTKEPQEVA